MIQARAELPVWRLALGGAAAILIAVGIGRFAYTPLIPALVEAGWFTPADAVWLGAINLAGYLVGAAGAPHTAARLSTARTIRGALLVAAASLAACAWPLGFWWYAPWRFAVGVAGGFLMVLAGPAVLARTPAGRRGRVGGILFTGVGLGIALSGTGVPLLARSGLTATWLALALLALLLVALAWPGWPDDRATAPSGRPRLGLGVAALVFAYALDGAGFVPHSVFWADFIARELGQGLAAGGLYWGLFGLGAASGPLLAGLVADRLGFRRSFTLALLFKGLAVAIPLVSVSPPALVVSSLVVGALTPGMAALGAGCAAEVAGLEGQRRLWSGMTTGFALAQAAGGAGFAALFAATGDYDLLFLLGSLAFYVAAAAAWLQLRSASRAA